MQAREIMTADVISVSPESSVRHIAQIMLRHRISAVPVIDDDQKLVGIVSEGDLITRPEIGAKRTSWWLGLLDCSEVAALEYVKSHGKQAQDVMTTDVITIDEDMPIARIATLIDEGRIKRVPVLKHGRVVGIVSRADLIRAVATASEDQTAPGDEALRLAVVTRLREDVGWPCKELRVTVSDGIVHLWGSVPFGPAKQAACAAAWTAHGIKGLMDHSQVELVEAPAELQHGGATPLSEK